MYLDFLREGRVVFDSWEALVKWFIPSYKRVFHKIEEGKIIKFDDSKIHSAVNNSKFDRVNLYLKFSTDGCAEALEST